MVASLNASQIGPLETFRPGSNAAVVPPKAAADEASILFAVAESHIQIFAGADLDHSASMVTVQNSPAPGAMQRIEAMASSCGCRRAPSVPHSNAPGAAIDDNFGVLRSFDDLEKLCRPQFQSQWYGSPTTRSPLVPLGRCCDNSDSDYMSDEEVKQTPTDGYLKDMKEKRAGNEGLQHLAVLFDSTQERDHCLSFFDAAGLIHAQPNLEIFV
jgi:hypothetical protein